ncbi:MAG: hypothetical protein PUD50_01415 [Eubacteriales bacterium]|nr:hypothetical protein [Eubacteriales bacterium]
MARLWIRMVNKHRVVKQETVACAWDGIEEALTETCRDWDIPRPVWLNKHAHEMEDFRRTAFAKDHFMEDVSFDRLEIEFLEDLETPRRSQDPRNQF